MPLIANPTDSSNLDTGDGGACDPSKTMSRINPAASDSAAPSSAASSCPSTSIFNKPTRRPAINSSRRTVVISCESAPLEASRLAIP